MVNKGNQVLKIQKRDCFLLGSRKISKALHPCSFLLFSKIENSSWSCHHWPNQKEERGTRQAQHIPCFSLETLKEPEVYISKMGSKNSLGLWDPDSGASYGQDPSWDLRAATVVTMVKTTAVRSGRSSRVRGSAGVEADMVWGLEAAEVQVLVEIQAGVAKVWHPVVASQAHHQLSGPTGQKGPTFSAIQQIGGPDREAPWA